MKQSKRQTNAEGVQIRGEAYVLRLFVAGEVPNSTQAKENLKRICETYLKDGYQSEIVDVIEDFQSALENNVLVTPTLILLSPPPKVTILGNLSHTKKVLAALRLTGGE
jgi:circadian clock protein KaiB